MAEQNAPLRFLAEPSATFRDRYVCEQGPHQSQRFQKAEKNPQYKYPTLRLSSEWSTVATHVCVTLVTVPNERVPHRCIHPYPLGNEDQSVKKDPIMNSLYFPITADEFRKEKKELRFAIYRLTKEQLQKYGPLKILGPGLVDDNLLPRGTDGKQIIDIYDLSHSQLRFCFARIVDDVQRPIIYEASALLSRVRLGQPNVRQENIVKCRLVPKRGNWRGGENVMVNFPALDRRRTPIVRFDHDLVGLDQVIPHSFVDKNTFIFKTPPCPIPIPEGSKSFTIPIAIIQSRQVIARVNFTYEKFDSCPGCGVSLLPNDDEDLMNGDDDDSSLDFDNSSELLNAISADDLQT